MRLSDNLNILPWYINAKYQNHKRSFAQFGIFGLLTQVNTVLPFQLKVSPAQLITNITGRLLNVDGTPVPTININPWVQSLTIVPKTGYSLFVNSGLTSLGTQSLEGQYYIELEFEYEDGGETITFTLFSEIFTLISDVTRLLKLEYWDNQDFDYGTGVIDYTSPFHNFLYLNTEVGKPDYVFEEEQTKRDGFNFVEMQISEKRYKFEFIAPEYLCDALRIVRMHDNVRITNVDGVVYDADTILLSPKWQESGDIAVVEAEFECNTVIKKIGKKFTPSGDYNNDFNKDYYNGSI